jgi:predicted RNase H-like HicB family nuclease
MLFPVYVHTGDDTQTRGAEVPDFPGCFSAADSWDELTVTETALVLVFDSQLRNFANR